MEIIGRDSELKIMRHLFEKEESQFLAMYGRRRVGKTYMIRKFYDKDLVFDCTGLNDGTKSAQLENFFIQLQARTSIVGLPPTTWLQAFKMLGNYLDGVKTKKKKVVFFDEISWFDTPRSGFMPAFANFWNNYCTKQNDIILVICGSAASWIIDKVINNKGGLYNRITQTIHLEPFTLKETRKYLNYKKVKLSDIDIAMIFMCIGGIPFYLNYIQAGRSIANILDDLFFSKGARLNNEFNNLYPALFKNFTIHNTITESLAKTNKGLTRNEIIKSTKLASGGGLTTALEELEACGFIIKTNDLDKKSEDGLYRITDEYLIFYFRFIHNQKGQKSGATLAGSQKFKIWSGFAFENLCIKHHKEIASALGIEGILYDVYSFIDKGSKESDGSQIDMVIDRADNVINIIEAKFHSAEYRMTKSSVNSINSKINSFTRKTKTKKSIFTTLITANGAEKNENFLEVVANELLLSDLM